MLNRFLSLEPIYQRAILGSLCLFLFLCNLSVCPSTPFWNAIAAGCFIAAWLLFGMFKPTMIFVKVLLAMMLFVAVFLRI
jgi:hypothetical protein